MSKTEKKFEEWEVLQVSSPYATPHEAENLPFFMIQNKFKIKKIKLVSFSKDDRAVVILKHHKYLENIYYFEYHNDKELKMETATYLADLINQHPELLSFELNCSYIQSKQAQIILEALGNHQNINAVSFWSNKMANSGIQFIIDFLKKSHSLRSFQFSCNNNIINIKLVNLFWNDLDDETSNRILTESIQHEYVKKLSEAIVENGNLVNLDLSHQTIGEESATYLMKILENNFHLTKLNLHGTFIGTTGIIELQKSMKKNFVLKELLIGDNFSGSECEDLEKYSEAISNFMLDLKYLEILSVSNSQLLFPEMIEGFTHTKIKHLIVDEMEFTLEEYEDLLRALKSNESLESLSCIEMNYGIDIGHLLLKYQFPNLKSLNIRTPEDKLDQILMGMPALTHLGLFGPPPPEGTNICKFLSNSKLTTLLISDISEMDEKQLLDALDKNSTLTGFDFITTDNSKLSKNIDYYLKRNRRNFIGIQEHFGKFGDGICDINFKFNNHLKRNYNELGL